jgi:hypothetical protein
MIESDNQITRQEVEGGLLCDAACEWIPVERGLPPKRVPVLVRCVVDEGAILSRREVFDVAAMVCGTWGFNYRTVTHWAYIYSPISNANTPEPSTPRLEGEPETDKDQSLTPSQEGFSKIRSLTIGDE